MMSYETVVAVVVAGYHLGMALKRIVPGLKGGVIGSWSNTLQMRMNLR